MNAILKQLEDERRELIRSRLVALGREIPEDIDLLDIPLDSELESDLESRYAHTHARAHTDRHTQLWSKMYYYLYYHSDGGSDSSVSDGPPVHMMCNNKLHKRKVCIELVIVIILLLS